METSRNAATAGAPQAIVDTIVLERVVAILRHRVKRKRKVQTVP
jgi:hypothetical protein